MSYENTGSYQIRQQSSTHFLTFTVVGWIDIFTRDEYKQILIESFEFCRRKKGLKIHAYVIMSNHVHTIWTANNNNLSDVVRDYKSFTSRAIVNAVLNSHIESRKEWLLYMFRFFAKRTKANDEYKFWQPGSHPEQIVTPEFFYQKLE